MLTIAIPTDPKYKGHSNNTIWSAVYNTCLPPHIPFHGKSPKHSFHLQYLKSLCLKFNSTFNRTIPEVTFPVNRLFIT